MADIFRLQNEDGSPGNWAYFSQKKGDIVDAGTDEQEATRLAAEDSPKTTIAAALAGDTSAAVPPRDEAPLQSGSEGTSQGSAASVGSAADSGDAVSDNGPILSSVQSAPANSTEIVKVVPDKPARPPLSPAFIKKVVDQLGRNTTNISIELERFLFKQFGFTTDELAEDDADVEIIKMGWDAIWQSYLAGKEPPLWMILAFGYSCATARLIASAKRIEKKESLDDAKTD